MSRFDDYVYHNAPRLSVSAKYQCCCTNEEQADIRTGSFGKFYLLASVAITEYVKTGNGNTDYEIISSNVYVIVGEKLPVLANQL